MSVSEAAPPEIARSETVVFRKSELAMSPPVVNLSTPNPERASDNSAEDSVSSGSSSGAEAACEIESLREALQQALEDKAELIEESFLDKERIKDQKETIELLTKRVREFEMARSVTTVSSTNSANSSLRVGSSKSNISVSGLQVQVKQLSEDNIELAKEVDRLVAERDKLEKKLIDIKLRQQAGRQSSIASTDEDEDGVFASYESLGKKNRPKKLGYNKKGGSVFAAAKNWFASKKGSPSNAGGGSSGTTKKSSSSSNFVSYSPSRSVAV